MNERVKSFGALLSLVVLDYWLRQIIPSTPGVIYADPITASLVIGATAAAASATTGGISFFENRQARKAQEDLANQRKAQLATEARERQEAKERAATGGRRAGRATSAGLLTGFGFGSGDVTSPTARGTLFGN